MRVRQLDPHVGAAAVARVDSRTAAVRVGYRLDDREPEPGAAARACAVAAGEALEGAAVERGLEARAAVAHVQPNPPSWSSAASSIVPDA